MSTMNVNQLAFPDLVSSLKDAAGNAVDPATLTSPTFVSSDTSIVTMELRAADGTPDPNGKMAAVAQAVGTSTITWTAVNPNGSTVTLTDSMSITPVSSGGNAVDGALMFNPPMDKPTPPTLRRR